MDIGLNKEIGNCLRTVRVAQGVTQVELADRMGETQSFVSKVEQGERALKLYEVFWYCEALEVAPEAVVEKIRREVYSAGANCDS